MACCCWDLAAHMRAPGGASAESSAGACCLRHRAAAFCPRQLVRRLMFESATGAATKAAARARLRAFRAPRSPTLCQVAGSSSESGSLRVEDCAACAGASVAAAGALRGPGRGQIGWGPRRARGRGLRFQMVQNLQVRTAPGGATAVCLRRSRQRRKRTHLAARRRATRAPGRRTRRPLLPAADGTPLAPEPGKRCAVLYDSAEWYHGTVVVHEPGSSTAEGARARGQRGSARAAPHATCMLLLRAHQPAPRL